MPEANFLGADLRKTRLAGINWEGASLKDADLRGATFHMGTTRSGMLFEGPSKGTRTGFYTDDADDLHYRAPEEIRVANLRGADLRGAWIAGVDFYLVDLRDAKYTGTQRNYFRKHKAIL